MALKYSFSGEIEDSEFLLQLTIRDIYKLANCEALETKHPTRPQPTMGIQLIVTHKVALPFKTSPAFVSKVHKALPRYMDDFLDL